LIVRRVLDGRDIRRGARRRGEAEHGAAAQCGETRCKTEPDGRR